MGAWLLSGRPVFSYFPIVYLNRIMLLQAVTRPGVLCNGRLEVKSYRRVIPQANTQQAPWLTKRECTACRKGN